MQPFRFTCTKDEVDHLSRRPDAAPRPTIPFDTAWRSNAKDRGLCDPVRFLGQEYDLFEVQAGFNRLHGQVEEEGLHWGLTRESGGEQRPPNLLLHE